ncbi:MAG: tetratricopeptide repeat protein [Longimicrobiales bacterium]
MPHPRELLDEGLRLEKAGTLDRALEQYSAALGAATDPGIEAEAWRRQAHVRRLRCEWDLAVAAARRSAETAAEAGLHDHVAEALNAEAAVYQTCGDFEPARALYERILRETSNERIRGVALQNLASVCGMQEDMLSAARHFREAYDCFARCGYAWGKTHVLNNLGRVYLEQGELDEAQDYLLRAIDESKLLDDLDLLALARLNYGEVLLARGAYGEAETEVSAAVGHFAAAGNQWRRIECLRVLGDLQAHKGAPDVAERFYENALRVAEEIGAKAEQQRIAQRLSRMRA